MVEIKIINTQEYHILLFSMILRLLTSVGYIIGKLPIVCYCVTLPNTITINFL